jgi:hypothetical protein
MQIEGENGQEPEGYVPEIGRKVWVLKCRETRRLFDLLTHR